MSKTFGMFAKVFSQIFDSSISANHVIRHVFMDLLVLADAEGVVDMTQDAIARRTNVPLELVEMAVKELASPDRRSRSTDDDGRRIVPLDDHRDWGWRIVNYKHYRQIRDEEARREYFRDRKRQQRMSKTVQDSHQCPPEGTQGHPISTHAEEEEEAEGDRKAGKSSRRSSSPSEKDPAQLRAERLFGKRPTTPWDRAEQTAWKAARSVVEATSEEDWGILERFYALPQSETFARKSLSVLLNNWNGEIEKARTHLKQKASVVGMAQLRFTA